MAHLRIFYCTFPDLLSAEKVARFLIEERLAACANLIGPITSQYIWQGNIEKSEEYTLLIKSCVALTAKIEEKIKSLHPYEMPCIWAVDPRYCEDKYANWVNKNLQ
ncbi:MAG: divalent-cation tolerance protein CutA [Oligoflexales bacterium]|nr:divalent-cation tolerance protein CutA [Oligoflexales bacterium]